MWGNAEYHTQSRFAGAQPASSPGIWLAWPSSSDLALEHALIKPMVLT